MDAGADMELRPGSELPENAARQRWVSETVRRVATASEKDAVIYLADESWSDLSRTVRATSAHIAKWAGSKRRQTYHEPIRTLLRLGAIEVVSTDENDVRTFRLVPYWWEASGTAQGTTLVRRRAPRGASLRTTGGAVWGAYSQESQTSQTQVAESSATLPPSAIASTEEPTTEPTVQPTVQPTEPVCAEVGQAQETRPSSPSQPEPTPISADPPPAKPRKPRAKRADSAEVAAAARVITDAWDVAWAEQHRAMSHRCPPGCDRRERPKCAEHWPGYVWTRRDIAMAQAAVRNGWSAPRASRLIRTYMQATERSPRSFGSYLSRLNDLETRNPPPVPASVLPFPATPTAQTPKIATKVEPWRPFDPPGGGLVAHMARVRAGKAGGEA